MKERTRPIFSDFYIVIIALGVLVVILQLGNYSSMNKLVLLALFALALLWLEKPEWFVNLVYKARALLSGGLRG